MKRVTPRLHTSTATAFITCGCSPGYTPLQARGDLEKKKRVFASLGLLVPLTKEGVAIRGLLTDESGATSLTLYPYPYPYPSPSPSPSP